jgi:hypothetical protein
MCTKFWFVNLKEKIARREWTGRQYRDRSQENSLVRCRLDSSGSAQFPLAESCGHESGHVGSIRGAQYLSYRGDNQLVKKNSASWSWA